MRIAMDYVNWKNKENKPLVGVEIGVWEGENALSMLRNMNIEKLYLVDPYKKYEDFPDGIMDNIDYKNPQDDLDSAYSIALLRLIEYPNDKIQFVKKLSSKAINDIPDELDFVYIDGNHKEEYVKEDMENYYKKLKIGGVLSGHDYNIYDKNKHKLIETVNRFALAKNVFLYNRKEDWWLIKR